MRCHFDRGELDPTDYPNVPNLKNQNVDKNTENSEIRERKNDDEPEPSTSKQLPPPKKNKEDKEQDS